MASGVDLPDYISNASGVGQTEIIEWGRNGLVADIAGLMEQYDEDGSVKAFYEKEGYGSMTAGCGTLLIQFPIIIGLYGAIYKPLSYIIRLDSATVKTLTDGLAELSVKTNGNSRMLEMNVLSHIDALEKALTEVPAEVFDQIRAFDFTAFGYDLGATPMDMGGKYMLVPIMSFAFSLISKKLLANL